MTCGIAVGSPQKASMSRIIQLLSLLMIATAAMAATANDGGPAPASTPATVPGVPGGAPAAAPGGDSMIFIMIGGMILFMWLLVIRPQKKEEKRQRKNHINCQQQHAFHPIRFAVCGNQRYDHRSKPNGDDFKT